MRRAAGLLLLALATAPRLRAQGNVASLIAAGRGQIDQFNWDSASALLQRALATSSGATNAERVRAYLLYGIAQLNLKNAAGARQAFRGALLLSPTEKVDSLEYLESDDLMREFNAVRAVVVPAAAPSVLAVDVAVPFDTTLLAPDGRLLVVSKPTNRARVTVTITPASAPDAPVWTNVNIVDSAGAAAWNLRARDGMLVSSGRYVLRVTAGDSLGRAATAPERVLVVTNPNARANEGAPVRVQLEENLAFATEPATTAAGRAFRVVATAQDAHGRTESRFHDTVTVGITPGTGRIGAHLLGTTAAQANAGVAVFPGLSLDSVGTDYNLTAMAPSLVRATSVSFDVTPGPASLLVMAAPPPRMMAADTPFRIVVAARDAPGNLATGFHDTVTVSVTSGTGKAGARLSGTTSAAAVHGVATFADLHIDSAGAGYTLTASAAATAPAVSPAFDVVTSSWSGWASLTAGATHTCGLTSDGIAYCWGDNDQGELGDGTRIRRFTKVAVAGGFAFTSLTAGDGSTCGLTSDGAAYCWGRDSIGELGDGSNFNGGTPVPVAGGHAFTSLTSGGWHTCGLTSAGSAYCWGDNAHGELGDGTNTNRGTPVAVAGGLKFVSVTAGISHTCGLTTGGLTYCWGWNYFGQLGDGSTTDHDAPVIVAGEVAFVSLTAGGGNHTCGLTSRGTAYCWGENSFGQVGDGSTRDRTTPAAVSGELRFTSLTAGTAHTCGVTGGGVAYCWGDDHLGELGTGATRGRLTPTAVAGNHTFTRLSASGHHTCGLGSGGTAFCWGWNEQGQLGDGTVTSHNGPDPVLNH